MMLEGFQTAEGSAQYQTAHRSPYPANDNHKSFNERTTEHMIAPHMLYCFEQHTAKFI